jgi:hypothetical protein
MVPVKDKSTDPGKGHPVHLFSTRPRRGRPVLGQISPELAQVQEQVGGLGRPALLPKRLGLCHGEPRQFIPGFLYRSEVQGRVGRGCFVGRSCGFTHRSTMQMFDRGFRITEEVPKSFAIRIPRISRERVAPEKGADGFKPSCFF